MKISSVQRSRAWELLLSVSLSDVGLSGSLTVIRVTDWIQEDLFTEDESGGDRTEDPLWTACLTASEL